jgi:hypothetical protein
VNPDNKEAHTAIGKPAPTSRLINLAEQHI